MRLDTLSSLDNHINMTGSVSRRSTRFISGVRRRQPEIFKTISTSSPEERMRFLNMAGGLIVFVIRPTEEEQLAAVTSDSRAIQFIMRPTEKVLMLAKLSS